MKPPENKTFIRNNKNLKAPGCVETMPASESRSNVLELIKCKNDIIYFAQKYFYIISPKQGKHLISLYDAQIELIRKMVNDDRVIVLASRQVGKTTAYNIFALWLTLFHPDKKILICANTFAGSIEFIDRIRLAYELCPSFLKCGITDWRKSKIGFSNGSSIEGTATSPTSARGKSCNCVDGTTMVVIKDKQTGIVSEVSMYQLSKLLLNEIPDDKIIMI